MIKAISQLYQAPRGAMGKAHVNTTFKSTQLSPQQTDADKLVQKDQHMHECVLKTAGQEDSMDC